ncbi:MAG: response regulator [Pseudobdellovibrionaceae bacterium]
MKSNIALDSTILIVDDDLDLLESITYEIKRNFSTVFTADRAQKAIEIIKNNSIDCVITDYRMPEMNGLDFIDFLQKNHPSLPVILVTGNGSDREVIAAIEKGLFEYLDKPFIPSILVNRVRNALLLPRLEKLILNLVKIEFPDLQINKFSHYSYAERLKALSALEGILQTKWLAKQGKKSGHSHA